MSFIERMRFPVLVMMIFAVSFVLGSAAGAVMYATGERVVSTVQMAMVSHTEYRYGEAGQIIARITDFQGNPVQVINCTAIIKYPDKTAFITNGLMTASVVTGDYYYNFTAPTGPEGVYEYQATCFYNPSNKNASVTNSFHLSSAFNMVLGNQSVIQANQLAILGNLTGVQGNLSNLSLQLAAVNSSLASNVAGVAGQVGNLSVTMGANFTYTNGLITGVNASTQASIAAVNGGLAGNFSVLQNNVSQILDAISSMTVNVNLTPALDAIAALNSSMNTYFSDLDAALVGNFTQTNGLIIGVNESIQAAFSVVNSELNVMNTTLNANNAYLVLINATTTNTYDYVTGTLATNMDDVLTNLGIINATVNRIETITTAINSTTNQILQNQQNQVNMQVFSG